MSLDKDLENYQECVRRNALNSCSISCATDPELAKMVIKMKYTHFYRDSVQFEIERRNQLKGLSNVG